MISEQEKDALANSTKKEIKEKKSFFYKYDPSKVKNNKRVYDFKAPGNPERHPSLALDHEHIDIQHYIDTSTLTPEKLMEIQAYYSYLVDLHISQIRPKLRHQSYIPPQFNQFVRIDSDFTEPYLDNKFSDFFH